MLRKERNYRDAPRHSQGSAPNCFWCTKHQEVGGLKWLNAHLEVSHFHMFTIFSVLSTIKKGDFAFRIDLILSLTDSSRQSEVPSFHLHKQGVTVQGTSIHAQHSCPGVYTLHTVAGLPHY